MKNTYIYIFEKKKEENFFFNYFVYSSPERKKKQQKILENVKRQRNAKRSPYNAFHDYPITESSSNFHIIFIIY